MFQKKSVFILALVFGLFSIADSYAQETTIKDKFSKPLAKLEMTPITDFVGQSFPVEFKSAKAPALDFSIRVPKGWTDTTKANLDSDIGQKVLSELKSYYGPANLYAPRSRITVEAVELDFDITAERWFIQHLLANGYNIRGLEARNDRQADALYVYLQGAESFGVRARAIVNGKMVIIAKYAVPLGRYHEEKVQMEHVIRSYKEREEIHEFVEDLERYLFLDIAEFKYPVSWKLRALPIRSIDRMKVELFNIRKIETGWYGETESRLDGQIDINLVSIYSSETLEEEFEYFQREIDEKGLSMGAIVEERDDFLFTENFDFVDTKVYDVTGVTANMFEHELWVTIMLAGEYYYFVTLFTPSRNHDYFLWARNVEAYKLVVGQLKPQEDLLSSGTVDTSAIGGSEDGEL